MPYIPPRPFDDGSNESAAYIAIWEKHWGNESQFIDTPQTKWSRSRDGKHLLKINFPNRQLQQSPSRMYPFRIYQAPNIVSAADNWRTFQMRLGLIGYRSKYTLPGLSGSGTVADGGNSEIVIDSISGSDSQSDFDDTAIPTAQNLVTLDVSADTPIKSNPVGSLPNTWYPTQFMLSDRPDDVGLYLAGIWVKITDDKVKGLSAQLYGRMFTGNPIDSTGRNQTPWPANDPSVFPIGFITCGTFNSGGAKVFDEIVQYQYGNLINRYPESCGVGGNMLNDRGLWQFDNLTGQVFWPGDVVVDDSVAIALGGDLVVTSGARYCQVYTFFGNPRIVKDSPTANGSNWKLFSSLIL